MFAEKPRMVIAVNDSGDLAASNSADYWGLQGMQAVVDDNTPIYVQDDTPNSETQDRTRFYLNPNGLTMAGGDILDLFTGRNASTDVLRIQLQKNGATYQIRSGLLNDAGSWTDTSWYDIPNAWSAIEIQYQAFANSGSLTLWLDDVQKQSLTFIDNDTRHFFLPFCLTAQSMSACWYFSAKARSTGNLGTRRMEPSSSTSTSSRSPSLSFALRRVGAGRVICPLLRICKYSDMALSLSGNLII